MIMKAIIGQGVRTLHRLQKVRCLKVNGKEGSKLISTWRNKPFVKLYQLTTNPSIFLKQFPANKLYFLFYFNDYSTHHIPNQINISFVLYNYMSKIISKIRIKMFCSFFLLYHHHRHKLVIVQILMHQVPKT